MRNKGKERKNCFLEVYIPSTCFKGKYNKGEFVSGTARYSLREIDVFTSKFANRMQLLVHSIREICKNEENVHGADIRVCEVIKEYEKQKLNMDYCIRIGKYDGRKRKNVYINNIILSDCYEIKELHNNNYFPIRNMIYEAACDDKFILSVIDKYNEKVISNKQIENQFSFLNLNEQDKNTLIDNIMSLVRNDEVDKEKLTEILKDKFNNSSALKKNVDILLDKHKRMNGLRKKVEVLDILTKEEDSFIEFINFAKDMTNDFTKYSSCRNIYFFIQRYNELKKSKNKVRTK